MAAYVLAQITIHDPGKYEEYRRLVTPTVEKFGGRFLVRGGSVDVLEGNWPPVRVVVLEFPTAARAREWWSSPEYSEARAIRQATSTGTLLLLDGV